MKKNAVFLVIILLFFAADQASKIAVAREVPLYSSLKVIPGFFNITHIHNKGAIFGAFSQTENRFILVLLPAASLLALGLVVYYFVKTPPAERLMKTSLSLILAGALGNLTDRIFRGYVIDFLDFYIGRNHWPFFNVADSCITVGAAFLIVNLLFQRKRTCTPSS